MMILERLIAYTLALIVIALLLVACVVGWIVKLFKWIKGEIFNG